MYRTGETPTTVNRVQQPAAFGDQGAFFEKTAPLDPLKKLFIIPEIRYNYLFKKRYCKGKGCKGKGTGKENRRTYSYNTDHTRPS